MRRPRDAELVKEHVGHRRVVMLPGVHEHFGVPLAHGTRERRRLDELRSRSDDGQESHCVLQDRQQTANNKVEPARLLSVVCCLLSLRVMRRGRTLYLRRR